MENLVYNKLKEFQKKYPLTVCWRLKQHAKVINLHLNPGEEVLYAFVAQKNDKATEAFSTNAVVLTNKRLMLGSKRLIFGYFFTAITPDMFNDLNIEMGMIWGKVCIDTLKETVHLSNIQREALPEIETAITEYMMREKKKYVKKEN